MQRSILPSILSLISYSLFFSHALFAQQIDLHVALAHPTLIANAPQKTYLKVSLTGFALQNTQQRAPVNVAIVLDKSGSMGGEKIQQAKLAAIHVLERLDKQDIVSVIAYDSKVKVIIPATKITDKNSLVQSIKQLQANGSTALYDGVNKGASEIRKFLQKNQVNRVILLSDGIANIGPSQPSQLAVLGQELIQDNISVTTIGLGLGYNEDLMTALANNSDGNHAFVEHASDLVKIFNQEFGDVLSVVAQEVDITIQCATNIRPLRVLGRKATIQGQNVHIYLNQLYSQQEKYFLLEVEIPAQTINSKEDIATVHVSYSNLSTHSMDKLSSQVYASFSNSKEEVKSNTDTQVLRSAIQQIAIEKNEQAVKLRDQGKTSAARQLLKDNALYLKKHAQEYNAPELELQSIQNIQDAEKLDSSNWKKQRKLMRKEQYKMKTQQSY